MGQCFGVFGGFFSVFSLISFLGECEGGVALWVKALQIELEGS